MRTLIVGFSPRKKIANKAPQIGVVEATNVEELKSILTTATILQIAPMPAPISPIQPNQKIAIGIIFPQSSYRNEAMNPPRLTIELIVNTAVKGVEVLIP